VGPHGDISVKVDPEITDLRDRQHRSVTDLYRSGRLLRLHINNFSDSHHRFIWSP